MSAQTIPWDIVNYLTTDAQIAGYIHAVLEDAEQPPLYGDAIASIARARGGYALLEKETGIPEAALAFAAERNDSETVDLLKKMYTQYAPAVQAQTAA